MAGPTLDQCNWLGYSICDLLCRGRLHHSNLSAASLYECIRVHTQFRKSESRHAVPSTPPVPTRRGTIGPCTTGHVTVTFKAGAPANFWRRVACLIKDADPIGVDFLATSYNEAARPPPLEHRHVAAYMARVTAGGPPVESDPALQGSVPPSPVPSAGGRFSSSTSSTPLNALSKGTEQLGAMQSLPGPDGWGLLFGGQDPGCAISVDREVLEFGSCSRLSAAEYQAVVVTNRTAAKVTAFFVAPLWQDPAGGEPKPVFQVGADSRFAVAPVLERCGAACARSCLVEETCELGVLPWSWS